MKKSLAVIFGMLLLLCVSCTKVDKFTTDIRYGISFSSDTIAFDTVFTSAGSSTKRVSVYNSSKYSLRLKAYLAGGEQSPFRLNADGESGTVFDDLAIWPNDSLSVFVSVTIDPRDSDLPFFVQDSVIFALESGGEYKLLLTAFGQDAVILRCVEFSSDTTLSAARPYIVFDSLCIGSGARLTINPGARLCFHKDAFIKCNGAINASGTADSVICFSTDRLDEIYNGLKFRLLPGMWGGIRLENVTDTCLFGFCNIQGAETAISNVADSLSAPFLSLKLDCSVIHNNSGYCVYAQNTDMLIQNCQVTNAAENCLHVERSGKVVSEQSTFANFYPFASCGSAVLVDSTDECSFTGCIITGMSNNELSVTSGSNVSLGNTLAMVRDTAVLALASDCVFETADSGKSQDKNFRNIDHINFVYNFELNPESPAVGLVKIPLSDCDLKGRPRYTGAWAPSSAGCYEYTNE